MSYLVRPAPRRRAPMGDYIARPAPQRRAPMGDIDWDTLNPFKKYPLPPKPEPGEDGELVKLLRRIEAQHDKFVRNDERARWVQIAATLSIPLAAAVWRLILGRKRSDG